MCIVINQDDKLTKLRQREGDNLERHNIRLNPVRKPGERLRFEGAEA